MAEENIEIAAVQPAADHGGADVFLSDVHIGTAGSAGPQSDESTTTSRFVFRLPAIGKGAILPSEVSESKNSPSIDEDGDMVVARRQQEDDIKVLFIVLCIVRLWRGEYLYAPLYGSYMTIKHALSTPLEDTGLQVWRGALLMADYLTHNRVRFQDSTVLELGAGTGLVSIVAALSAKSVFCTDIGVGVLELSERNVSTNLRDLDLPSGMVYVRELDWTRPLQSSTQKFSWTDSDLEELARTTFILAADVIYVDALTDALLSCIASLLTRFQHTPTILISLEKRINFTLEDMAPVSPAYQHFKDRLRSELTLEDGRRIQFDTKRLSTDYPLYFKYERVKELKLWELKAHFLQDPQ